MFDGNEITVVADSREILQTYIFCRCCLRKIETVIISMHRVNKLLMIILINDNDRSAAMSLTFNFFSIRMIIASHQIVDYLF